MRTFFSFLKTEKRYADCRPVIKVAEQTTHSVPTCREGITLFFLGGKNKQKKSWETLTDHFLCRFWKENAVLMMTCIRDLIIFLVVFLTPEL